MPNLTNRATMSNVGSRKKNSRPMTKRSRFRCPHCSFIGCNMQTLRNHALHHSTRFSLQCPFCTFSVSHKNAMARHINHVHSKKAAKRAKQKKSAEKTNKADADIVPGSGAFPIIIATQSLAENEDNTFIEEGFHNVENRECDEEDVMVIEQDGPDNPGKHMTKLIKAIASFTQVYQEKHNVGQISDNVLGVDSKLDSNDEKEEIECHKELDQLVKDIRSCRVKIAQASREMEAETRLDKAEHLRQRMELLKVTEQGLSVQLAVLMEQKRRIQEEATVKTELRMKTDRELFLLKFSSCSKVKQEYAADSAAAVERNRERIQKKEALVARLKKKLDEIGKEESHLNERIQTTERKLEENTRNLAEIRSDLVKLSSSSITARINTLKSELRERVNRFAYLEELLIALNSKRTVDDIKQRKKDWLDRYGCNE